MSETQKTGSGGSGLSASQRAIFDAFCEGHSIFITGPAGCGKSFLLQHIRDHCESHYINYAATALTGAAACLIGGQTLHGWGGLGLAQEPAEVIAAAMYRRPPNYKRWRDVKVLIIDEVSMMSAELFNKVHLIAQILRKSTAFYGGIQVVLCGDFAQLEPIGSDKYCFESSVWKTHIGPRTYYLATIMRQSDPVFQKVLTEIRLGTVTAETKSVLNTRLITDEAEADILIDDGQEASAQGQGQGRPQKIKATILYPKKKDVSRINTDELQKLITEGAQTRTFVALDCALNRKTRLPVTMSPQYTTNLEKGTTGTTTLVLCVGAQVMLLKNMDLDAGLVNGTRGVVVGFDAVGYPIVVFDNGRQMSMAPVSFEMESGQLCLIRKQIPLILAWALTIHKCQGATLTNVITDLSETFGYAQTYVTLSRVRSLEGLFLISINYNKIQCNPKVRAYYESLRPVSVDAPVDAP